MNEKELKKYDKQVRQEIYYRSKRPCDGETVLMAFIVKNQEEFPKLRDYTFLLEFEYDDIPGRTDIGRGDLILTDGKNKYLIVETKFLSESKGKNIGEKNRKRRRDGENQAYKYAIYLKAKYSNADVEHSLITSKTIPTPELSNKYLKFRDDLEKKWKERERIVYPITD